MACLSFAQFDKEPFCEYFNKLEGFLDCNCCNIWEACEICYFGLNEQTRDEVECMHNGEFRALSIDDVWDFYVWFARMTIIGVTMILMLMCNVLILLILA